MKNDVIVYRCDSFVDYKGEEHKIVACAVSQSIAEDPEGYKLSVAWTNGSAIDQPTDVTRLVSIGISICNPTDKYDTIKGEKMAYNRAVHDPKCPTLYATKDGVITTALVNAFIDQEVSFIKENPEKVIKGYNKSKEIYEKRKEVEEKLNNLSEDEEYVMDLLYEGDTVAECLKLYNKAKSYRIDLG